MRCCHGKEKVAVLGIDSEKTTMSQRCAAFALPALCLFNTHTHGAQTRTPGALLSAPYHSVGY